jgi:Flp pilus assembly protein CpaB
MAYFGGKSTGRPWPRIEVSYIVIAASLAICASLVSFLFLSSKGLGLLSGNKATAKETIAERTAVQSGIPMATVLVPTRTLNAGEKLSPLMFEQRLQPVVGIENKIVTDQAGVKNLYLRSMVVAGTPLLKEHISGSVIRSGILAKIPKGYRAIAIPIDAESGVEGWCQPGTHVDVVWSTVRRGKELVTIIVEDAEIISAGKSTKVVNSGDKSAEVVPKHVTLLVTRKDAQKIQLAKNSGSLSLNLRGSNDVERIGSDTTTIDSLLRPIDIEYLDAIQGEVRIGKEAYVYRGGKLRRAKKDNEDNIADGVK